MSTDGQQLAPIDPAQLYPLEVFQQRTGLRESAMRTARKNGLPVRYVGNRGFVYGEDWIQYVLENSRSEK